MKYFLLCTALLQLFSFSFPSPILPAGNFEDLNFLKIYLDKFFPALHKWDTLVDRIQEMQKFFHLTMTGKMDTATRKLMKNPRCGVSDVQKLQADQRIWNTDVLTYRINTYTPDLPSYKVDEIIEKAFRVWSEVIPMSFIRVYGPADIEIWFAYGEHGDNIPFDGRGKVLAHAFFPNDDLAGDAHFDEDEMWSEYNIGTNLFLVAVHEFGHSLGLRHSNVQGALMYPFHSPSSYANPDTYILPLDDVFRIQELYGRRT